VPGVHKGRSSEPRRPWREQLKAHLNPNGGATRPVKVVKPGCRMLSRRYANASSGWARERRADGLGVPSPARGVRHIPLRLRLIARLERDVADPPVAHRVSPK
jgi:hypothetical protein